MSQVLALLQLVLVCKVAMKFQHVQLCGAGTKESRAMPFESKAKLAGASCWVEGAKVHSNYQQFCVHVSVLEHGNSPHPN